MCLKFPIMLSLILLSYMIVLTDASIIYADYGIDSTSRSIMRQIIVKSMSEVENVILQNSHVNTGFNLCRVGVDRAILCEAINVLLNGKNSPVVDQPCEDPLTLNGYFTCLTQDGLKLKLATLCMENKIVVETEYSDPLVFQIPKEVHLLTNSASSDFVHLYKYMRTSNLTAEAMNSTLQTYYHSLSTAHSMALELRVYRVTEEPTPPSEDVQGPGICHNIVNRGILCRAINIFLFGQTFPVKNNPCVTPKNGLPHFPCRMATGDTLFMERGDYKSDREIYLRDFKNRLQYVVQSLPIQRTFINKYVLSEDELEKLDGIESVRKALYAPETSGDCVGIYPN